MFIKRYILIRFGKLGSSCFTNEFSSFVKQFYNQLQQIRVFLIAYKLLYSLKLRASANLK